MAVQSASIYLLMELNAYHAQPDANYVPTQQTVTDAQQVTSMIQLLNSAHSIVLVDSLFLALNAWLAL